MKVLVTGGAGYIGSHTCIELALRGYEVEIVDSFANSSPNVLPRLKELAGREIPCHRLDLRSEAELAQLLATQRYDAVIHFAALKAVGESVEKPLEYFDNNIGGTISLLRAMRSAGVEKFIFSSSCTVYGSPDSTPVDEGAKLQVSNPYGRSKLFVEQMLWDVGQADRSFRFVSLRYFNPVGAHPSGRVGEDPLGIPNNLMPLICQVAVGRRAKLFVYGGDWPTLDGTGIRDYIHVVDLAKAHVAALDFLEREDRSLTVNLGTGKGASVLELIATFEQVTEQRIPFEIVARRPGDVAALWADPALATRELLWRAELGLQEQCRDAWRWQRNNPQGYGGDRGCRLVP